MNANDSNRRCDATIYQPAHIDGRTVVVLCQEGRGFRIVESGRLSFDGETLSLIGEESQRTFSDDEVNSLKLIATGNRIPECYGFDLFVINEAASNRQISPTSETTRHTMVNQPKHAADL